jgi:hypothetical protein
MNNMKKSKTIILSGLIAGSLDAIAAILLFAHPVSLHNASKIFRFIASGLLGRVTYSSGFAYPFIGLFLHFLFAMIWSAIYFLIIYPLFKPGSILAKTCILASFIWIVMNGFVVPLSAIGSIQTNGWSIMKSFLVLVVCVALPITLITEKRK